MELRNIHKINSSNDCDEKDIKIIDCQFLSRY